VTITTGGIDLAKNVFAVNAANAVIQNGKTVLVNPKVSRAALPELSWFTSLFYRDGSMLWDTLWTRIFRQYGMAIKTMMAVRRLVICPFRHNQ